jgi:hypothetical protein
MGAAIICELVASMGLSFLPGWHSHGEARETELEKVGVLLAIIDLG